MHRLKIFGIIVCFILIGCAGAAPKPETAETPALGEKTETVEKTETAQPPQTPQMTQTPQAPSSPAAIDPYNGRSLPYGMKYGMSKKQITSILSKETGGAPKEEGPALVWSGLAMEKPRIVVLLAAVFDNNKLVAFIIKQVGKNTDETYQRMEAGYNRKLIELKSKYTLKDSQLTDNSRAVLFQTAEGHFLVLLFHKDDQKGFFTTELRHLEKLPSNTKKAP